MRKFLALVREEAEIALLGVILQEMLQGLPDKQQPPKARSNWTSSRSSRLRERPAPRLRNSGINASPVGCNPRAVDIQIAAARPEYDGALLTRYADSSRSAECRE